MGRNLDSSFPRQPQGCTGERQRGGGLVGFAVVLVLAVVVEHVLLVQVLPGLLP